MIKNIEHAEVMVLKDQVSAQKGQVVSKTLAQNDAVSITLFAFAQGEEIGTHVWHRARRHRVHLDRRASFVHHAHRFFSGQFGEDGKRYVVQKRTGNIHAKRGTFADGRGRTDRRHLSAHRLECIGVPVRQEERNVVDVSTGNPVSWWRLPSGIWKTSPTGRCRH